MSLSASSGLQASGPAFFKSLEIFPGFHFFEKSFFFASVPSLDFLIREMIKSIFERATVKPSKI